MLFLWAAIFILVFAILYYSDRKIRLVYKGLHGPPGWPFVGNAMAVVTASAGDLFQVIEALSSDFGQRVLISIGQQMIIMFSDAKDVEVIMNGQEFINKSDEYRFLEPWLGTGLLTSKGDKWRKHRKIITPAFHFKILENFIETFEKQSSVLIDKLSAVANGEAVDIYPIIGMYALDVISETAMGVSINAQKDNDSKYVAAVKDQCEVLQNRMKDPLKQSDFLFSFTDDYKKGTRALKIMHDFTDKMICERRKVLNESKETLLTYTASNDDNFGRKKKMAFLDMLLLSHVDGKPLSDVDIREEVDTFLFEGHDTTSSAISFTLHLLAQHPEIQKKLYEEQLEIFGPNHDQEATYTDLHNMKYMELVLKEALRLYPSVPMLGRKTTRDTKINDLEVKAGTSIIIMVYSMNRDPDVFPNPDKFIPERFLTEESNKRNPFATISFSAGSRNCIGQKFAMLEMKSCLSRIVRTFELFETDKFLELRCDLILKAVDGVHIKLKPRNLQCHL